MSCPQPSRCSATTTAAADPVSWQHQRLSSLSIPILIVLHHLFRIEPVIVGIGKIAPLLSRLPDYALQLNIFSLSMGEASSSRSRVMFSCHESWLCFFSATVLTNISHKVLEDAPQSPLPSPPGIPITTDAETALTVFLSSRFTFFSYRTYLF